MLPHLLWLRCFSIGQIAKRRADMLRLNWLKTALTSFESKNSTWSSPHWASLTKRDKKRSNNSKSSSMRISTWATTSNSRRRMKTTSSKLKSWRGSTRNSFKKIDKSSKRPFLLLSSSRLSCSIYAKSRPTLVSRKNTKKPTKSSREPTQSRKRKDKHTWIAVTKKSSQPKPNWCHDSKMNWMHFERSSTVRWMIGTSCERLNTMPCYNASRMQRSS